MTRSLTLLQAVCVMMFAVPPIFANEPAPAGSLMMIGGGQRATNELLWNELVRLAGGRGKRIAIFPTASSYPESTGQRYLQRLAGVGLEPFIVPLSPVDKTQDYRALANDSAWCEKVRSADAVYLVGGDQARYRKALFNEQGHETKMLEAIRHVYQRGGLIAGTSAGTAVMSRIMFINAELILPVLVEGARMQREVDLGIGFLPEHIFVDQHFIARGRFGRALVAMQTYDFSVGLGVDEDTALVIERGSDAKVVGYSGAIIMDAREARRDANEKRFNWKNLRLSFLSHGDQINLQTMEVKLASEKKDEDKVDPFAPDFKPYYVNRQFYNDVFSSAILLDLMHKLVDSPFDDAVGLSFDGLAAQNDDSPAFEFRFSRRRDTASWEASNAPGSPLSVLNVYLDVQPVRISEFKISR